MNTQTINDSFGKFLEIKWQHFKSISQDRSEFYVAEVANRWAMEYGRTEEYARIMSGEPLARIAKTGAALGGIALAWLNQKRAAMNGFE